MNSKPYTVSTTTNNGQSTLFSVPFESVAAAQDFLDALKRGQTGHCISVELTDPVGNRIELVQLGSIDQEAVPRKHMTYDQLSKPIEPLTTGKPSFLLID